MNKLEVPREEISYLRSPAAIRERAEKIFDHIKKGNGHFAYHEDKLSGTVDFVCEVIKENYPDFKVPYHSRWGHFQAGGVDRRAEIEAKLDGLNFEQKLQAKWDLTVISVLLDAGAGNTWSYDDNGTKVARSEGLAVASLNMFNKGIFSSNPDNPYQVDGQALLKLTVKDIEESFQVSKSNPLLGVKGRLELCLNLGQTLQNKRVSDFLVSLLDQVEVSALDFFNLVLENLSSIWPGRTEMSGENMGDLWHYSDFGDTSDSRSYIPFHKLSQWLTYSLIEPFEEAGMQARHLNSLTGLAEYRNGGLFVDSGLISLRNQADGRRLHEPHSNLIIEWRALTICLLDIMAEKIRLKLNMSSEELPLVKVLEGGTWHAGRKIAKQKREDGTPPLNIVSDGTVF